MQPPLRAPAPVEGAPSATRPIPASSADHAADGHDGRRLTVLADPLLPASDGAKVKMGLFEKKINELIPYLQNHIEMMADNANFPRPQPPTEDFQAAFEALRDDAQAVLHVEALLRDTVARRDQRRAEMTAVMNVRAAYVQEASNGNRQVILSSGLGVKSPATPVTALAAPTNLRVDLNGEAGVMKIRWEAVEHTRIYLLQISPDVLPRQWAPPETTTKTQVTKTMEVGVTYVFRVAAAGTPGQSNWSPEVIRGAA